jgi:hypothetical protein
MFLIGAFYNNLLLPLGEKIGKVNTKSECYNVKIGFLK